MVSNTASLLILTALVALMYFIDRKHFKREGIMFLRRTEKFNEFVHRKAEQHRTFFQLFGDFGVVTSFGALGLWYVLHERRGKNNYLWPAVFAVVSFVLMSFIMPFGGALAFALFGAAGNIMYFLGKAAIGILLGTVTQAGVQLVLPVQVSGPVFYVPIHYWLVALFVIVTFHEFAHAFVSRAENVRVKSMGYGFLAIIPLAFAEPDEAQLKKKGSLTKNRVFSAGSFSNILTAIFILIFVKLIFMPLGIVYGGTVDGSPANTTLPAEGVITEINGIKIDSYQTFFEELQKVSPGQQLALVINNQPYEITATSRPENASQGFIGITSIRSTGPTPGAQQFVPKESIRNVIGDKASAALSGLYPYLFWIYFLSFGIALANLMPLKPLDGGLMFEELVKKFNLNHAWVSRAGWLTAGILLFNMLGPSIIRNISVLFG